MVTAVVAVCAALLACGALLFAFRRGRAQAERRLDTVLARVDQHLKTISASVADAVDAALESRSGRSALLLTLDFDDLLDGLVAEAALRTGADAAIVRVEGPAGRPAIASYGAGTERESLDRSLRTPCDRYIDSPLIYMTFSAAPEPAD